jgi:hypothetical protein
MWEEVRVASRKLCRARAYSGFKGGQRLRLAWSAPRSPPRLRPRARLTPLCPCFTTTARSVNALEGLCQRRTSTTIPPCGRHDTSARGAFVSSWPLPDEHDDPACGQKESAASAPRAGASRQSRQVADARRLPGMRSPSCHPPHVPLTSFDYIAHHQSCSGGARPHPGCCHLP